VTVDRLQGPSLGAKS